MLFNSFDYLIFLIVITTIYFATQPTWRWLPLLVGSYFFYMCWHPAYILLIIISTIVDFAASKQMAATDHDRTRKMWLLLSLISNLGLLFFFKYYNFFTDSVAGLLDAIDVSYRLPHSNFLLP
ncbi:MAG: MBOAT family protein, partial [Planctomycetota bacterium]